MAWTSMHFAIGMAGGATIAATASLIIRRGWRFTPVAMTLGGLWAVIPDTPRLFREDFPWLGLAESLGSKNLEHQLHAIGNLFFFHQSLDVQPREFALHGLIGVILLYNIAIGFYLVREWQQRNSLAARARRAHLEAIGRPPAKPSSGVNRYVYQTPQKAPDEEPVDDHEPRDIAGRIGLDEAS